MKVVTSYENPDLDGTSCMYAYSELLNKLGLESNYYIWGQPKSEVRIVCNIFDIKLKGLDSLGKDNEFIITDFNGLSMMHKDVNIEKLVEVIDHHTLSKDLPKYKNAKIQIENVGAAATLVAERFKSLNIKPSREAAILLFYGIISNSINLKAKITSKKDIEISNWLKQQCDEITTEKIEEIFRKKSIIDENHLREEMECEITTPCQNKNVIVGQIEIVDVDDFLRIYKNKIINILKKVKEEKNADYAFINCVDILNGYIRILGADKESNNFVNSFFDIPFSDGIGFADHLIQRKEMTAKLRSIV